MNPQNANGDSEVSLMAVGWFYMVLVKLYVSLQAGLHRHAQQF